MTGTLLCWRRRLRISNPSMPGSMTSRTTRSTPGRAAISSPRWPSWAHSTMKPSRCRNSLRSAQSSASSSTNRMFTARIYHVRPGKYVRLGPKISCRAVSARNTAKSSRVIPVAPSRCSNANWLIPRFERQVLMRSAMALPVEVAARRGLFAVWAVARSASVTALCQGSPPISSAMGQP